MQDTPFSIPVLVSCPSRLNSEQLAIVELLRGLLQDNGLEGLKLGAMNFSSRPILETVLEAIRKCYGGLVLGFEFSRSESMVVRCGQESETHYQSKAAASPWNQIEATALLARNLPVLIFKDRDIQDGVFDHFVSGGFVLEMPDPNQPDDRLRTVIAKWAKAVQKHYEDVNSIFDVFLSFSGEDEVAAREVFEFLTAQGLRVFFSRESIPQLSQADYMKAINTALDKARHMVVVSGSAAGFAKPWVEREWTIFLNEKLSERKSGNLVIAPAGEVPVALLPIALRSQQVVNISKNGLLEILKFVSTNRARGLT